MNRSNNPQTRWHFDPDVRYPGREGPANASVVHVRPWEPIDAALKRLKKRLAAEDIPFQLKRHASFVPRNKQRRHKSQRARKRVER